MQFIRRWMTRALLAAASMWILSATTLAQTYQAWVDPTVGTAAGQVSVNGSPPVGTAATFLTIQQAIAAIQATAGSGGNPALSPTDTGLVHCLPGIYSPGTNGEPLPIRMQNYISLQGTAGARATVVKGAQNTSFAGPGTLPGIAGIYLPTIPNSRATNLEVLIDASALFVNFQHMIDGFTTRGGHVQYYMETEGPGELVISNCVLDMLHLVPDVPGAPAVRGPWFGVLKVADYFGTSAGYIQSPIQFLNNTVIMARQSGPDLGGTTTLCQTGAVGFCDVSDPLTNPAYGGGFTPDPLARQQGLMRLNVQNDIVRTIYVQQFLATNAMAFLGVDSRDTSTTIGSRIGPTDAFDQRLVGGTTLGGPVIPRFQSGFAAGSTRPIPWIDVNPRNPPTGAASGLARDPAFVGEYWSRQAGPTGFDMVGRDWRILPSSAYVDAGSSPSGGVLASASLVAYIVPGPPNALLNSFDFDGEAYGNPRIAETPLAPSSTPPPVHCDIGFDEASNFIESRNYANDSNCHNTSAALNAYPNFAYVNVGQPTREVITPLPGTLTVYGTVTPMTPFVSWDNVPGLVSPPSFVFGGNPIGYNRLFLPLSAFAAPIAVLTTTNRPPYTSPFEAGVVPPLPQHVVASSGPIVDTGPTVVPGVYNCFQCLYSVTGVPSIPTNTQAEQY